MLVCVLRMLGKSENYPPLWPQFEALGHNIICFIFVTSFTFYLFESHSERGRETQSKILLLSSSLPRWLQHTGLGQDKDRSQKFHLCFPGPGFPGCISFLFSRKRIRSRASGVPTNAHMGCQCCVQQLNYLCHNARPLAS